MLAIHDCLAELARKRPLFHSEADFQLALAWHLQRAHLTAQVRLEVPFEARQGNRIRVDILFQDNDGLVLLELKYTTRGLELSVEKESFRLANQGAQDVRRYDCIRDIVRLETLVNQGHCSHGYAILLSNDPGYWTAPLSHTVDAQFRLHEDDNPLYGTRHWDPEASAGTRRGRETPLPLSGRYCNQWRDYSRVSEGVAGQFRYLLHEVRAVDATTGVETT